MYKLSKDSIMKDGIVFPLDPANRHYQQFLDDINDGVVVEGEDVIEPSYAELRAAEYPSMADQLDMQYWDNINGTTVWQDTIQAIKDKYPTTITGGVTVAPVPQELLDAAAEKLFNKQLAEYKAAVARLEEVQVSVGRARQIGEVDSEEQAVDADGMPVFDAEGNPVFTKVKVELAPAIEPAPATIEVTEIDEAGNETTSVVPNPAIVQDDEERAAAQAVIDATPQAVKDAA